MYQFYYAEHTSEKQPVYQRSLAEVFRVTALRPAMWEEHCLECSAPVCFSSCAHFEARRDGRCKRFASGLETRPEANGCCGQGVRVKFRKWANMMTIIFPAMLSLPDAKEMTEKNQRLGNGLGRLVRSSLPVKAKWMMIRTAEYLRRRSLRALRGMENTPDAFVFHGYSFEEKAFRLMLEVYDSHTPLFKTSILLEPGENLVVLDKTKLDAVCATENYLVKLYPENDLEAELDILWCDFVKGSYVRQEQPAPTVKCLVWDLDNTLWNGTLVEIDENALPKINPGVREIMAELDRRGILQSIASKNEFTQTWPVVEKLGIADYFLYPQIHWGPKSDSMEQIAGSLNIGIDSLVLVDDVAFEREQVRSVWPQVRTYDVTELEGLLARPEFSVMATEESKNRRLMYKAEEKRNRMKAGDSSNLEDFLRKCHLRMHMFYPETEEERLRCYELVTRTNQLNMSGIKYTPEQFGEVLARADHRSFAVSCEDNFGSYGLVGFGQYRKEDAKVVFTEYAMSCRVAGKYVESALFRTVLEKEGCAEGRFEVHKTKKNLLLRETLEEIGFCVNGETDREIDYIYHTDLKNADVVEVGVNNAKV